MRKELIIIINTVLTGISVLVTVLQIALNFTR
jgi:hypothetical protein